MVWTPGQGQPGGGLCKVWLPEQRAGPLPVLLYLPGAGGGSPMELTKKQKKFSFGTDVAFYDNFIVVSPEVRSRWESAPYFWLMDMCEAIRCQRPGAELVLVGFSKGARWGGLFLATKT